MNTAVLGNLYCKYHACSHAGCTVSKSSSDKACGKHLSSKPRSKSTTAVIVQQRQQPQQQEQQWGRTTTVFTPARGASSADHGHSKMRKQTFPTQSSGKKVRGGKHQSSGKYGFADTGGGGGDKARKGTHQSSGVYGFVGIAGGDAEAEEV